MRAGERAERRRDELGAGAAGGLRGAARRLPGGRHRPLRALRRAVAGAPLPHHLLVSEESRPAQPPPGRLLSGLPAASRP